MLFLSFQEEVFVYLLQFNGSVYTHPDVVLHPQRSQFVAVDEDQPLWNTFHVCTPAILAQQVCPVPGRQPRTADAGQRVTGFVVQRLSYCRVPGIHVPMQSSATLLPRQEEQSDRGDLTWEFHRCPESCSRWRRTMARGIDARGVSPKALSNRGPSSFGSRGGVPNGPQPISVDPWDDRATFQVRPDGRRESLGQYRTSVQREIGPGLVFRFLRRPQTDQGDGQGR